MAYVAANGIVDDISNAFGTAKKYGTQISKLVAPAKAILDDPALPEVVSLVMELKALRAAKRQKGLGSLGDSAWGGSSLGDIGLKDIVGPLRYYVGIKKQPALGYLTAATLFAIPFAIGYLVGKRK